MKSYKLLLTNCLFLAGVTLACYLATSQSVASASASILLQNTPTPSPTATPSPTPVNEELRRLIEHNALLAEEKKKAELEADIAKAESAKLGAKFPAATATPLKGETSVTGEIIEKDMLGYAALDKGAVMVAQRLAQVPLKSVSKIAVYSKNDIDLLQNYRAAFKQLHALRQEYEKLLVAEKEIKCANSVEISGIGAASAGLTVAKSLVGSFVDLTSLFRTDVKIEGKTFDIAEEAIAAEVFQKIRVNDALKSKKLQLYYPKLLPPKINQLADSDILLELQQVYFRNTRATGLIEGLRKAETALEQNQTTLQALREKKGKDEAELAKTLVEMGNTPPTEEARLKKLREKKATLETEINEGQTKLATEATKTDLLKKERDERLKQLQNNLRNYVVLADVTCQLQQMRMANTCDATGLKAILTPLQLLSAPCYEEKLKSVLSSSCVQVLNTSPQNPGIIETLQALNTGSDSECALNDAVFRLEALNRQFKALFEAITKTSDSGNANALTNYLKAESLLGIEDYWLQLSVIKAGGSQRIKTNLIVDVFTGGNRLSYSGGAILQFHLFDQDGASQASGAFPIYQGYINSRKLDNKLDPKGKEQ